MRTLSATPIDPERYAPFGAVVAAHGGVAPRIANHGAAVAWDALATLIDTRGSAAAIHASLFRCKPLSGTSLEIRRLERHPRSTQLFVPMNATRYLVIVAQGGDDPDLSTLAAFVVGATQAITYAPGIWHHPMVALAAETDFVNIVGAARREVADGAVHGTTDDCDERAFDPPIARVTVSDPEAAA